MSDLPMVKVDVPSEETKERTASVTPLTNGKENGQPAQSHLTVAAKESQAEKRTRLVYNIKSWILNKALVIVIFLIWFIINVYFFYDTYQLYCDTDKFFYMSQLTGSSLCISRATAYLIYINGALVLLPMCRGFLAYVRTVKSLKGVYRRLVDHTKGFHIYVAYTLVISSVVHTFGHLVNNYRLVRNFSYKYPALNLVDKKEDMHYGVIFTTVPGATGVIMLIIFLAMTFTAFKTVRQKNFEVFWYTHHLYIVFYALYLVHGFGNIVKWQNNLDVHKPRCESMPNGTRRADCKEPPTFTPQKPEAWKWMIFPLTLFLIDKAVRLFRRQGLVEVKKIILHEGKVMEIRMKKEGFAALPGQYIRLNCPDISKFEWHPFTLTRVPTAVNDEIWVQIKVTGEWTEELSAIISPLVLENKGVTRVGRSSIITMDNGEIITGDTRGSTLTVPTTLKREEKSVIAPLLRLKVEGPYGGPCQDVTRYRTVICVGAGIGVTPFAALLNSLRDQVIQTRTLGKMEKIYFIWVCRAIIDFSWFLNILYDVYLELQKAQKDILVIKLFVTRGNKISEEDASLIAQKHEWQRNLISYGRPKWKVELENLGKNHARDRIGVFFCGPSVAGSALNEACLTASINDNVFLYHKEALG